MACLSGLKAGASNAGWHGAGGWGKTGGMERTESPLIAVAVCLAALAGFVDAQAFMSLGGFFAAFMSANTTRLGVGLGGGTGWMALTGGALVLSFVSGVIVASVLRRARGERHRAAVMLVASALMAAGAAAAWWLPGPLLLLFLAGAMGCVHALLHGGDGVPGLASVTTALVGVGERLAAALMGDADRWGWVPHLALWLGFLAGAVMGAAAQWRWGASALWIAPSMGLLLTLVLSRMRRV